MVQWGGVGGPRAEKGGGRRMGRAVGVRGLTAEAGGRRRKHFSASVGGKGSQ